MPFGFGRVKCPVSEPLAQWIEERWTWLTTRVDAGLPRRRMLVPTSEDLPVSQADEEGMYDDVYDALVRHVGLDPARLPLFFYEEDGGSQIVPFVDGPEQFEAGVYGELDGSPCIGVETQAAAHPPSFIATISHELAHAVMLGQGHLHGSEDDHEELTDLTTVHLGLGVFAANGTIHESAWTESAYEGWSIQRLGYLSPDAFGYALALRTLDEGEAWKIWVGHLRPDVRTALERARRYLASGRRD